MSFSEDARFFFLLGIAWDGNVSYLVIVILHGFVSDKDNEFKAQNCLPST